MFNYWRNMKSYPIKYVVCSTQLGKVNIERKFVEPIADDVVGKMYKMCLKKKKTVCNWPCLLCKKICYNKRSS